MTTNSEVETRAFTLDAFRRDQNFPAITLLCRAFIQADRDGKWAQSCAIFARSIPTVGASTSSSMREEDEPAWFGIPKGCISESRDDYAERYAAWLNEYLATEYRGKWRVQRRLKGE